MKNKRLLEQIGKIDERFIAEAEDPQPKANRTFIIRALAAAACLLLIGAAALAVVKLSEKPHKAAESTMNEPEQTAPPRPALTHSTARVVYDDEPMTEADRNALNMFLGRSTKPDLEFFTEEEMFSMDDLYIFRGTVASITNVLVDFSGNAANTASSSEYNSISDAMMSSEYLDAMSVVEISISRVYKGDDIKPGDSIKMLLYFPIVTDGSIWIEDTGVGSQLRVGMEGIFMPHIYDDKSCMEQYDSVLYFRELAECGLGDGWRWMFIKGENTVLYYAEQAYPSAGELRTVDQAEEYVLGMLEKNK